MPRKPRLDAPGLLCHIVARGIDRDRIFNDDNDRRFFLERLGGVLKETATPIYAFTLIPNHFHLLLHRKDVPISKVMSRLLTSYAIYFNRKHERVGHLFQNRYKSIICADNVYFLELIRYIDLNPLRAGIVGSMEQLEKYGFSSYSYVTGNHKAEWFDAKLPLKTFGAGRDKSLKAYRDFLSAGYKQGEITNLDGGGLKRSLSIIDNQPEQTGPPTQTDPPEKNHAHDSRVLGIGEFVDSLCGQLRTENPTAPKKTFEQILSEICATYGISATKLLGRSRVKETLVARTRFATRLSLEAGMSGSDIARRLSMSRSAVSRMLRRGEKLDSQDQTQT